ncbi:MAG: epoxyqueuosine reductase QueH [Oscillospiraceae bacterium]|nr:epoxyqueuosine reductase QueH [Oscillospiraceae bacterium]
MNDKQNVLLHCCCAPCASSVLERLTPQYNVSVVFYNPNIEPFEEHDKRKKELAKLLLNMPLLSNVKLIECEYDNAAFNHVALSLREEPEGGKRCRVCFKLRLSETARLAKTGEYDLFATTLSVSPHKDAKVLNEIGNNRAEEYGIEFLSSDFKKKDGYKRSIELSNEYGLYRQNYCGCQNS